MIAFFTNIKSALKCRLQNELNRLSAHSLRTDYQTDYNTAYDTDDEASSNALINQGPRKPRKK